MTQTMNQAADTFASGAQQAGVEEVPIGILEIPLGVWGSRRGAPVAGQPGKIEVFAEETSTVIVFPHGAVIRLSAAVSPGQMLMVTNRKSREVAACRVVKSKNYSNAKGYAEIEFFRSTNNFWGAYAPQGMLRVAASTSLAAVQTSVDDFWTSNFSPEIVTAPANAATASSLAHAAVRNQVTSIGMPGQRVAAATASGTANSLPSLAVATARKLSASAQQRQTEEPGRGWAAFSWIRASWESLLDRSARPASSGNFSTRRTIALASVAAAILFIAGGAGLLILHRGATQSASLTEINTVPDTSAVLPAANNTASAQPQSDSSSAAPSVPIIAKTENFPGSQTRGFAYNARSSQPAAKASSLERKIANGKTLAAPVVAHHTTTTGARELPPNVNGVDAAAGASNVPAIFSGFSPTGGRVKEPRLVVSSSPNYPAVAKQTGVEGEVTVSAVIDIAGKLTSMKVISGSPLLQQAALESLRNWKYEPALLNDRPLPVQTSITVKFRLR
jgi:TonB family protein